MEISQLSPENPLKMKLSWDKASFDLSGEKDIG
jgi:hypothetical protein